MYCSEYFSRSVAIIPFGLSSALFSMGSSLNDDELSEQEHRFSGFSESSKSARPTR